MLYLEDYLEMIEHLPQELRDRFTEMREMDLQVQNASDSLEDRVKTLFSNAKRMTPADRDAKFEEIKRDYNKVLEDADEKVSQANQLYELVDRYLRRLDTELHKFKMELEADNRGITEILEKRSLELDLPNGSSHSQKENRAVSNAARRNDKERERDRRMTSGGITSRHGSTASLSTLDSGWYQPGSVTPHIPATPSITPSASSSNLAAMASGVNAIAAAASQAIAATQQMQLGRRSASMKASYEALHLGQSSDLGLLGHASGSAPQDVLSTPVPTPVPVSTTTNKRQKRKRDSVPAPEPVPTADASREAGETEEWGVEGEWVPDPNEPRYCLCNQVSYGDMVACDNPDCPYEWFHYPCVGITAPPKGKWYCPQCSTTIKRRGRK